MLTFQHHHRCETIWQWQREKMPAVQQIETTTKKMVPLLYILLISYSPTLFCTVDDDADVQQNSSTAGASYQADHFHTFPLQY